MKTDATAEAENPYASPQFGGLEIEPSIVRIRAVARVFKLVGWFGVVLYTPIVIGGVASLVITLSGYHRIDPPAVLAGTSAFNGAILALALLYVMTGRRIATHDLSVRRRALLLSCVMMIGFPIFTIVGIISYRHIKLYFNDRLTAVAAVNE